MTTDEWKAKQRERAKTIAQLAELDGYHRPHCSTCPDKGHHWMLSPELEDESPSDDDKVWLMCRHCNATFQARMDDPHLPGY